MNDAQEALRMDDGTGEDLPCASMTLPAVLDLAAAASLLESVQKLVREEGPIGIDASAVEVLTSPCVQIILAARQHRGQISIENPSAAFTSAFEDLGIDMTWGAWDVECISEPAEERAEAPLAAGSDNLDQPTAEPDGVPAESGAADLQQISENVMSKRIMTIDDSKTMRDMLMLTLAEAGFDVLQAVDGQDGLDVLDKEQVDVVITDINMPRMDGYEVIRQLRKNPNYVKTPILVLTTEAEVEKRNLAREAGASGWMVKPFDPDRLVETVRKVAS
jgi:two-component system, chemotaxis family, chemotaxis protein CheY